MSEKKELDGMGKFIARTIGGLVGVGVTAVAGPVVGVAAGFAVSGAIESHPKVLDDLADTYPGNAFNWGKK